MSDKKKIKKVTTVTEEYYEDAPKTNEKTHIICILDRSGSMSSIIDDSIGGFNTFLKQQKELPDEATITVALFDDRYDLIYDNVDIKNARELTKKDWFPRGTTALYDAIGKTINSEKARLDLSDKKTKVLVCVVTDGYENSSTEYNNDNIKSLIKDCENDDWNFIYLAANQDAFSVGRSFGISGANTYTYTTDTLGVMDMSDTISYAATSYRSMSMDDEDFNSKSKSLIDDDSSEEK
ncbi:MAG: hypothetical protein ACOC2U_01260 [bacterium]